MLAGGAISWRSAKQTLTATSTTEAEFVACFEATSQGVWLKSFISGLRVVDSIARPLKLYCDNSAAVFLAKNHRSGSQSKHIDIKYHFIRYHVEHNAIHVTYCPTEDMVADALTKALPSMKAKHFAASLGLAKA